MSPRTLTKPPNDSVMWRALIARAHPDAGGDHDLFIWADHVRELVCGGGLRDGASRSDMAGANGTGAEQPARVPFPVRADHAALVCRAVTYGRTLGGSLAAILARLTGYQQATSGRAELAERRGATYKQARYLAAIVDVSPRDVYDVAERIPMSQAMAGYLISELKERAA